MCVRVSVYINIQIDISSKIRKTKTLSHALQSYSDIEKSIIVLCGIEVHAAQDSNPEPEYNKLL